jgi:hypothetical protein
MSGKTLRGFFRSLLLLACDGLLLALSGTGVCSGPLAAKGKPLAVPEPPVTAYIHKALYIQGNFGAKAPFHLVIRLNNLPEFIEFFLTQIIDKPPAVYLRLGANILRAGPAYSVDIGQGNIHMLIRKVNPQKTRHKFSYPCFCLCLGFWQIIRTMPFRFITLHLSQIGLTLVRTFILSLLLKGLFPFK